MFSSSSYDGISILSIIYLLWKFCWNFFWIGTFFQNRSTAKIRHQVESSRCDLSLITEFLVPNLTRNWMMLAGVKTFDLEPSNCVSWHQMFLDRHCGLFKWLQLQPSAPTIRHNGIYIFFEKIQNEFTVWRSHTGTTRTKPGKNERERWDSPSKKIMKHHHVSSWTCVFANICQIQNGNFTLPAIFRT